ncbi:MAG: hypothetical protein JWP01_1589 [Myxococcales bacterium]|nr:hypothetical protein [Myxococcales bacterium]
MRLAAAIGMVALGWWSPPARAESQYGTPRPLDGQTRPLDKYRGLPISIVEMHAQWVHDAQLEGVLSQDVDLMLWMFSATVETFAAIEQYQPKLVGTSEARLARTLSVR